MHKLVILIETLEDQAFTDAWPEFLHAAEQMPGLLRESTSQVDDILFGATSYSLIHELYFETPQALQRGMSSPQGQEAGRILQEMTQGKMVLLFADHKEDDLERIRRFHQPDNDPAETDTGPWSIDGIDSPAP